MSSRPTAVPPPAPKRKAYKAPKLTVFGPLSKMTQNGTGSTSENNGHSVCGVNFAKSGGASC